MGDFDIQLRRIPYPYKAMMAICSDLDETPNRQVYWEIMRFLNTTETTPMGPGLGLEVGNSIYFDMPVDQFAYWNTDEAGRAMIRALIRSGHIDCLHSYGDLATTRADAARSLDELAKHDCWLELWVDHGTAPTNFDPDIMCGHGDESQHEVYHADLTTQYGIRYVWRGRVTSIIGQDIRPRLRGILVARHACYSARTVAKEVAKRVSARFGNDKYAIHRPNRLLQRSCLQDETPVFEFLRCNPFWRGVGRTDKPEELADVLTKTFFDRLVKRGGACILYTHLGKMGAHGVPLDASVVAGFRCLADYCHSGEILVTTTRRMLVYSVMRDRLTWSTHREGNVLTVDLRLDDTDEFARAGGCLDDLSGLTFYIPDGVHCCITMNGATIERTLVNPPDHTGRSSVSVSISRLSFPDIKW